MPSALPVASLAPPGGGLHRSHPGFVRGSVALGYHLSVKPIERKVSLKNNLNKDFRYAWHLFVQLQASPRGQQACGAPQRGQLRSWLLAALESGGVGMRLDEFLERLDLLLLEGKKLAGPRQQRGHDWRNRSGGKMANFPNL